MVQRGFPRLHTQTGTEFCCTDSGYSSAGSNLCLPGQAWCPASTGMLRQGTELTQDCLSDQCHPRHAQLPIPLYLPPTQALMGLAVERRYDPEHSWIEQPSIARITPRSSETNMLWLIPIPIKRIDAIRWDTNTSALEEEHHRTGFPAALFYAGERTARRRCQSTHEAIWLCSRPVRLDTHILLMESLSSTPYHATSTGQAGWLGCNTRYATTTDDQSELLLSLRFCLAHNHLTALPTAPIFIFVLSGSTTFRTGTTGSSSLLGLASCAGFEHGSLPSPPKASPTFVLRVHEPTTVPR